MNKAEPIQHKLKQILSLSEELNSAISQPKKADEIIKEMLSKLAQVEMLLEELQLELEDEIEFEEEGEE